MTLAIGASINESPASINATGFVLKPDGTVVISVYSRGRLAVSFLLTGFSLLRDGSK